MFADVVNEVHNSRALSRGWKAHPFCPRLVLLGFILAGAAVASSGGQASSKGAVKTEVQAGDALSTRVVAYQIEARLDPAKKTVDAAETLTYHNLTGRPLDTFPFHLYLNAFQPTSTFMREVRLYGTRGTGPECRRSRRNLNNPPRARSRAGV